MCCLQTVTCGSPVVVLFSSWMFSGVNQGDVVTYTCESGYLILGQNTDTSAAFCGSDGDWANVPECVGKNL